MLKPDYESMLLKNRYDLIVGIDEVGRGCWAGALYMCGFVYKKGQKVVENVNDSKVVSKKNREMIADQLCKDEFLIEIITVDEIDRQGLGKAMHAGLENLIKKLSIKFKDKKIKFLIDGYFSGNWGDDVEFVTKGDSKVYSIASASIIAKVTRDACMSELSKDYPNFDFEKHVGYGTKMHMNAIVKFGITEIHRKSFKPIKRIIEANS